MLLVRIARENRERHHGSKGLPLTGPTRLEGVCIQSIIHFPLLYYDKLTFRVQNREKARVMVHTRMANAGSNSSTQIPHCASGSSKTGTISPIPRK